MIGIPVANINYQYIRDTLGDTVIIDVAFHEDVSGSTWLMQWRTLPDSDDVVATATIDTTAADEGVVEATVDTDDPAFSATTYYSELQRTTGGIVETWPRVVITLEKDVSHV